MTQTRAKRWIPSAWTRWFYDGLEFERRANGSIWWRPTPAARWRPIEEPVIHLAVHPPAAADNAA